jgi:radical SAM superfamily enzyme YgiQ (UPF0313 family)
MKILLINPENYDTFFSYKHALKLALKKSALPPLGLLTVASLLPDKWQKKMVDMNVEKLKDSHLEWADMVFISAMVIQRNSAEKVIAQCNQKQVPLVAGGPLFNHLHKDIQGVAHFVLGEAEEVLNGFLADLESGKTKPVYRAETHPSLAKTPVPAWGLIKPRFYHSMAIQFSRGCPFDCDFCDIVNLFGRKPRFKSVEQVLDELEAIHKMGWRGAIMFVDDNFIGNKPQAKNLLKEVAAWQQRRGYPFNFNTQASINLAEDPILMDLMIQANMSAVFLGIESPSYDSLKECHKVQNQVVDLKGAVRAIQDHGIVVSSGFIIGFDSDPESIFDDQVRFIEQAAIPTAMVGLLSAGPGTRLFKRLDKEGRLLSLPSGNNTADLGALNFQTKMNREDLIAGYRSVLQRLYEPGAYYNRVLLCLDNCRSINIRQKLPRISEGLRLALAAVRISWRLGVLESGRLAFWRFLFKARAINPVKLASVLSFAALGYHFKKCTMEFASSGQDA